jgi:hypothetical protein
MRVAVLYTGRGFFHVIFIFIWVRSWTLPILYSEKRFFNIIITQVFCHHYPFLVNPLKKVKAPLHASKPQPSFWTWFMGLFGR